MILRRFIEHVKDQNWFAVGLDVLVVITGIFLGMQVTDWNDTRKDAALEIAYLERLSGDLRHNAESLEESAEFHAHIHKNINALATVLIDDSVSEANLAEQSKRLAPWGAYPTADVRMGAWEELVSTGRLSLISDQSVREALQTVATMKEQADGQFSYIRSSAGDWTSGNGKFLTVMQDETGEVFLVPNLRAVVGDTQFIQKLLFEASRQNRAATIRKQQAETNQKALDLVKCALDQRTCPPSNS
ncbi:hypothetical protein GCM10017044_10320 [Kordiimonas sediminis]|uniref:Uncharacterized protein n=1 Tax=Kordiimonas sediminis TaxID=1735581 RepID=A0A919ANV9_9PROT|nr:hypothetical protein [Kordiimonas sediminis]GHF17814.1 hypothetical protein GCM10017044_10320 [Kordiimonas sediminis]